MMPSAHTSEDDLVKMYRYLCRRGARRFLRPGLDIADLEQVAVLGLLKALKRYDQASGTPFEAYAWLLILGELGHHVRDREHLWHVPRRTRDLERHYDNAVERLTGKLEREPSVREIAEELRVTLSVASRLARARSSTPYLSLDELLVQSQLDESRPNSSPLSAAEAHVLVEQALSSLEPIERAVILAIYGLGISRAEAARKLKISPSYASRLHQAALTRMRTRLGETYLGT